MNHAEEQKKKIMELENELRKTTLQLENAVFNLILCVPTVALLSALRPEAAEALGRTLPPVLTAGFAKVTTSINSVIDQGYMRYGLKRNIRRMKDSE